MLVKLLVKNVADPTYLEETAYPNDRITIGREEGNLLVLPDEKRIISKEHAEIRTEEGRATIVDLGSKNFTYVNGTRLAENEPAPLADGDVVRLGDFEIQVHLQEEEPALAAGPVADDRTVFAFNPFWEDAARLRDVLEEIKDVFAREMPERRREALFEAIRDATETEEDAEVLDVIAAALTDSDAMGEEGEDVQEASGPKDEKSSVQESAPSRRPDSDGRAAPPQRGGADVRADSPAAAAAVLEEHDLADVFFRHMSELFGVPWRFRHEFIGQTIMQSDSSAVLYDGDEEALREFLLDPSLSTKERERRYALLEDAADQLRLHLVALVDGYRATAHEGVERFLDEIDLDVIEEQVAASAKWYERPFVRLRALKILIDRVNTLRAEDWAVTERRVFRPAFIKAYLARMTSTPRP